ncbi:MAG: RDD family protein [Halobacteriovoraceae bacterium]|nr:RDD family protein [Halobacteriovoraceae bacterium]
MESEKKENPFSLVVISAPQAENARDPFCIKDLGTSRQHIRKRVWAFAIDLSLVLVTHKLIQLCYVYYVGNYLMAFDGPLKSLLAGNLGKIETFSTFIVFWCYFLGSYYLYGGRSVGKILFGLKVQSMTNPKQEHLSFQEVMMRSWGYFFCLQFFYLPFLACFLRRDQRGLQDWMSKTHIVNEAEWEKFAAEDTAIPMPMPIQSKNFENESYAPKENEQSQMELFEMTGS